MCACARPPPSLPPSLPARRPGILSFSLCFPSASSRAFCQPPGVGGCSGPQFPHRDHGEVNGAAWPGKEGKAGFRRARLPSRCMPPSLLQGSSAGAPTPHLGPHALRPSEFPAPQQGRVWPGEEGGGNGPESFAATFLGPELPGTDARGSRRRSAAGGRRSPRLAPHSWATAGPGAVRTPIG